MSHYLADTLWAGTETSLEVARVACAAAAQDWVNAIQAGTVMVNGAQAAEQAAPDLPYNASVHGNVGVVTTRGPLINEDNPYARYRGMTTYPDIRRAFIALAKQDSVTVIMHDIGSGGGSVAGVSDTGELISSISDNLKPVFSFTDSTMMSAALWLGLAGKQAFTSNTGSVGSIGVLSSLVEVSKMLTDMGINAKVIRSGPYKALGHQMEPMTQAAIDMRQEMVDATAAVFTEYVANKLGMTPDSVDKTIGQGREFTGIAAAQAGLVAGVTTFDRLMGMLQKRFA